MPCAFSRVEGESCIGFGKVIVASDLHRPVAGIGHLERDCRRAGIQFDVAARGNDFAWDHGRSPHAALTGAQPSAFRTRFVDAGYLASIAAGRTGRLTRFTAAVRADAASGRRPAQSAQNVHSNVQIVASRLSGGRSLSQHSQLGLSSSMSILSGWVRAR
jgi:hypothetical protein